MPDVENPHGLKYVFQDSEQVNCILLGKTKNGKSTLMNVLRDPEYMPSEGDNTLFSSTKKPTRHATTVRCNTDNKIYQFNCIDTPGLRDVRSDEDEKQNDDRIIELIGEVIMQNFTTLSFIGLVFDIKGIESDDLVAFKALKAFLGSQLSAKTLLILTHCESKSDKELASYDNELRSSSLQELVSYCELGHVYVGALDASVVRRFGDIPELRKRMLDPVMRLRDTFLDKVLTLKEPANTPSYWLTYKTQLDEFRSKWAEEVRQKIEIQYKQTRVQFGSAEPHGSCLLTENPIGADQTLDEGGCSIL